MGQPSTSAQVRAVALRESVASCPPVESNTIEMLSNLNAQEQYIIGRAERFADYIENGVQHAE